MNAYQLYDAAFDSSCDDSEPTVEYLTVYADGAFNLTVSDEDANKIINIIKKWAAHAEDKGLLDTHSDHYYMLEQPLKAIELGHCLYDDEKEDWARE